ncbi:MAG TPA: outer membrane protein transport protein [Geminicoccaceae bacterium]|nr:outer membrane protein transport protein [Geminicoccaceae bacterium]
MAGKNALAGSTVCAAALAAGIVATVASPAMAAGFWAYEMGTPDLGTASAGRAALAKDAATVFGNPAGMTRLDRSQLLVGMQVAVGDVHFDRGSDTTVSGGNGGNASGTTPGGSFYFAQSVTPDLKLGFWSGSYFAGSLQYEDGWSGRYYNTRSELITLGAGINGAYRINDWLSIGGGSFALYGRLEQRVAVNNVLGGGDGSLRFSDDEPGVGGMAGIMLEPIEGTRFGVTYISPVDLDFKDRPSTKNLGAGLQALGVGTRKIKLGLTVPQQVMLSGYHAINERLAIMGNFVWQNWSAFGKPEISVASTDIDNEKADLDYDDTFGFALATQYAFAEGWLWSFGGGFDTSPMSKSERSPSVPLDQQFRIGTGLQYSFNENITVGAAYQYMNAGDADLDVERGPLAGRLQGDYKSNDFHFLALNLSWRL